jgi:hypothetical protein
VTLLVTAREDVEVTPDIQSLASHTLDHAELQPLPSEPTQLLERLRAIAAASGAPDAEVFVNRFRGGRLPPAATIQSIRITANPCAPEYGELGRARIEITTKAATTKFNGHDLYDGHRAPNACFSDVVGQL